MLINDFFRMMFRTIKENKLLFSLWMMLQIISFCLVFWTLYNYQYINQGIWQYKNNLQWDLKETIHIEIRIPGVLLEDSYPEDAERFINDCKKSNIINKIGVFSNYNDSSEDFPYQFIIQDEEMMEYNFFDLFYLDSGVQDLCDLEIKQIDKELIKKNHDKLPILAGADYKEAKIGDCFHGNEEEYIVVGTLKENAYWFSSYPINYEDGLQSLDSMMVVLLPDSLPQQFLANGFNNIYINCDKNNIDNAKKQVEKLLEKNGLIGIVNTAEEVIQNYIDNDKENYIFIRNIAIMCMLISILSGIAIQYLIVQKQKYSLAVYFVNGLRQKYIAGIFGLIVIVISIFVFLLSILIGIILISMFQELKIDIFVNQTIPISLIISIIEILILFFVICNIIYHLQYRDIIK